MATAHATTALDGVAQVVPYTGVAPTACPEDVACKPPPALVVDGDVMLDVTLTDAADSDAGCRW